MRDNYDDFERLLGAKIDQINAQIAVGGGAGAGVAAASGGDTSKFDKWITFHEPKINMMQRKVDDMVEEL